MNREKQIEDSFIRRLTEQLKYVYRNDIHDRASLEANFRQKFEALNRVNLSDSEFDRLLEEIIDPDVFASSKRLRERNTFIREDGTPLQYTLVNIKDWCKNDYEVINQLRMNTDNSYHRYDVILLINGIPVVQVELKTYEVSPRKPCFALCNCLLLAINTTLIILQIITINISLSTQTSSSSLYIGMQPNETRR